MATWLVVLIFVIIAHQCWIRGREGNWSMRLWGLGFFGAAILTASERLFHFLTGIFVWGLNTQLAGSLFLLATVVCGLSKMLTGRWWPFKGKS